MKKRAKNHMKVVKTRPDYLQLRGHPYRRGPEEETDLEVSMERINWMGTVAEEEEAPPQEEG